MYSVDSSSLNDLLKKHDAPKNIDYLSVDTEGSKYEILSHFDFDAYNIKLITVQHNYNPTILKTYKLLTQKGYQRKYLGFWKWDEWYVELS